MDEEQMKKELDQMSNRLETLLKEQSELLGAPKTVDPHKEDPAIFDMQAAAERLVEKFSVGSDARPGEDLEKYWSRKFAQDQARLFNENTKIKI